MLQSRSAFRRSQKIGRTHHRHRPGRDVFFPPFSGISVFYLLGSNLLLRPVELGPVDPHAMQNDCELARDRDLGLAEPVALDELHSQAFTANHFGPRVSRTPAASNRQLRSIASPHLEIRPDQSTSPEAWRLQ